MRWLAILYLVLLLGGMGLISWRGNRAAARWEGVGQPELFLGSPSVSWVAATDLRKGHRLRPHDLRVPDEVPSNFRSALPPIGLVSGRFLAEDVAGGAALHSNLLLDRPPHVPLPAGRSLLRIPVVDSTWVDRLEPGMVVWLMRADSITAPAEVVGWLCPPGSPCGLRVHMDTAHVAAVFAQGAGTPVLLLESAQMEAR